MTKTSTRTAGANIRAEMARRQVTQTEMAQHLGITQPALSKRIRGIVPLNIDELAAIADRLEVPLDAILHGVGTAA